MDPDFLRQQFTGAWMESFQRVRTTVGTGSTAEYNLTVALPACFHGVAFAWALNKPDLVAQLRQTSADLISRTIDSFSVADIHRSSGHLTLAHAGVGTDPNLVGRYASMLVGRPQTSSRQRNAHSYREDLLDGLAALVAGDDAAAQSAATRIHHRLEDPGTAPTVHLDGIPHAIDAVARRDQAAFDQAADHAIRTFSRAMAGTSDRPAGPESLLYPTLSLVARAAIWRGLAVRSSPYVLTVDEPALLISGETR